jgi:NADH-quinone oxidoreductase subunit J
VLDLIFYLLAVIALAASIAVIMVRDIFRAALCLIVLFMSVAGFFLLLHADFLAIVQVLIYVGAISILIIVAIMLTRDARQGLLLIALAYGILNTTFTLPGTAPLEQTIQPIGQQLFGNGYVLPVEIAAVLLLSAILGAIAVLRDK